MEEPNVTLELAVGLGLLPEEYARIVEILGRIPTYTELGVFSVMWSEHCSYKNSISVLKTLPRSGGRLLVGAGEENAGLVDIGNGLAVAFKIESHNHPSAVEPCQGAATGVGGILRDIFTMGARPIAALNSLRFGNPDDPRVRYVVRGVVKGIGDYGNSFGVPTVAGEVYFDDCYRENPIVNAMAVGIVETDKITKAVATGEGNPVLVVGSSTGRDGIHGATFASEEISEESEKKRPSVQVGDPFTGKLLLEATLEAIETGYVVGMQDMGAAGITCSTSEMSARGKTGMVIHLDRVPTREEGMTAYEIMLSESQERMLVVARKGYEEEVRAIYAKWDLHAQVIGNVSASGMLSVHRNGKQVVEIPVESLVLGGGAPVYTRRAEEPGYLKETQAFDQNELPEPSDLNGCLLRILSSPNIASKHWVYEQYDSMVRTNTVVWNADAAVIRIKGTKKALAVKTDCNARYTYLNPRRGGIIAVAESARNVVCAGAEPIAITNCLNFGNPYKPEIFWQFKEAVAGIAEACKALNTPVTGGNVSFYNENPEGTIYPTPVIGMLGLIESLEHITTAEFKDDGDIIIIMGPTSGHLGGSEYLKVIHGLVGGDAPAIDLVTEKNLQSACLEMIRRGIIKSAHDVSEGGLAVAIAEGCMVGENVTGATVRPSFNGRKNGYLFGEDQSRIVVTADKADVGTVQALARKYGIAFQVLGETGGQRLRIGDLVDLDMEELTLAYRNAGRRMLEEV